MTPVLHERFRELLARARKVRADDASDVALLEALAFACVLDAAGVLDDAVSAAERAELKRAGARALLRAPDDEDTRLALGLARTGYGLLTGREIRGSTHGLHPTDRSLVEMRKGEPEPLVAASVAAHVRGCSWCKKRNEIAALADMDEQGERPEKLSVAAKGRVSMRSPSDGLRLLVVEGAGVELVLFEDAGERRLAAYAADSSASLELSGGGLAMEAGQPGYWLGRVPASARALDVTLLVGKKRFAVAIELPVARRGKKR